MKKRIILILTAALLMSGWGCTAQQPKLKYPVTFYYLPQDFTFGVTDSVLVPEQREGYGMESDLQLMLSMYLKGPAADGLRSPFPTGTTLLEYEQSEDTLHITLSKEFATLQDSKLTLACAAITKTCLELTDCVNVRITAKYATLDGEKSVVMNAGNLLLLDQSEPDITESK